jgi:hypothetical protein
MSRRYSEDEIGRALYAVALASGNHARASRDLAEAGIDIPSRTLHDWTRDKHRQRYEEIKLEAIPEIYAHLADEMESLVSYQLDVERKLTEKIEDEIDELPPRELAGALRNVAVSRGISLDKTGRIRGENSREAPRGTVENLMEILGAVQRLAGDAMRPVIEGQSVEVPQLPESGDENGASRP